MNQSSIRTVFDSFVPARGETDDVARLHDLTDAIESAGVIVDLSGESVAHPIRPVYASELLRVFGAAPALTVASMLPQW